MSKKNQKLTIRFIQAVPITQVKTLVHTQDRDVKDVDVDWAKGHVTLYIVTPSREEKMVLVPISNVRCVEVIETVEKKLPIVEMA